MAAIERQDGHVLQTADPANGCAASRRQSGKLDYDLLHKYSDAIDSYVVCALAKCRRARRCMADSFSRGTCKRRCMPKEYW